ncbi:MAG: fibronectin type III domain-containing protein [Verrucomicrobia bacterium]|nr:fibronectin type III domain-containing protein [Verrucomicrobiota bacterium]
MRRTAAMIVALVLCAMCHTGLADSGATLDLKEPRGIDVDSQDRVVVAYAGSHVVAVYSAEGELVRLLGRFGEAGEDEGHFNAPYGVTAAVDDSIYVSDTGNNRLCVFRSDGVFVRTIGDATGPGKLNQPHGCELDEDGNVLVADTGNNRIVAFSRDGRYLADRSIEGEAAKDLREPNNLMLQSFFRGRIQQLFVANTGGNRMDHYEWRDGRWVWIREYWANPDVTDIASTIEGDICTACPGWRTVRRRDVFTRYLWDSIHSPAHKSEYGLGGRGVGTLDVKPYGIAITSDNRVLVSWPEENRLIKYTEAMLDPPRPVITRVQPTSVVVEYESLMPVQSAVQYSPDGKTWTTVQGRGRPATKHAVKLPGLKPGTQYRFRVQYGCSFVPKTPFWGREYRFASGAPKGMVRYLNMPVLVVFYTNAYEPAGVPDGVEPPMALDGEGLDVVKAQLGQGASGYYWASRWLVNIRFDWLIINDPYLIFQDPKALDTLSGTDRDRFNSLMRAERTDENRDEIIALLKDKLGDALSDREIEWLTSPTRCTQGPQWDWGGWEMFDALAQKQFGRPLADYAGCLSIGCEWHWHQGEAPNDLPPGRVQAAAYTDPADPSNVRGFWRQAASGGLTNHGWGEGHGAPMGRAQFSTGSGIVGLFFHEWGHKTHGQFIASGYPEFPYNHFAQSHFKGRYDYGISGNGYALRVWPTEWYFASILGEVKLAPDADNDGLADDDPNLWCDEGRFGSSPKSRDTDGDGLSDYDEMLTSYGLPEIEFEGERMIERLIVPRPDLPDSDGDGLIDGRDPLPLYPVPATIAKRTPVLDGRIEPGEWNVYRTYNDGELVGACYMAWDDDAVYFALAADRWAEIIAKFDWAQDGFLWGRDNLFITFSPDTTDPMAPPPSCLIDMRIWNISYRGIDLRDSGKDRRLLDSSTIRTATGAMGEIKVLEIAFPRNLRVSLDPHSGKSFDFACAFRPVGSRSQLNLFEIDWAVPVTLVDKE